MRTVGPAKEKLEILMVEHRSEGLQENLPLQVEETNMTIGHRTWMPEGFMWVLFFWDFFREVLGLPQNLEEGTEISQITPVLTYA